MSAAVASQNLENDIRTLAQTKRIRVTEFFQDFDKLRSGFITGNTGISSGMVTCSLQWNAGVFSTNRRMQKPNCK